MISSFQIDLYRDAVLKINRNIYQGKPINAKPFLLLTIMDAIETGLVGENRFYLTDDLVEKYKTTHRQYVTKLTPFFKPFYYLQYDGFWHLRWRKEEDKSVRPSMKMLHDYVDYAYLDNVLWDLLQDKEIREMFRNMIINHFLK